MNSSHYSAPEIPPTQVLVDMILWYATPALRRQMILEENWQDPTLLEDTIDLARELIETWRPTSPRHWQYVRKDRHVEWLIWQAANRTDETMTARYTHPARTTPWWEIDIDSLPRYDLTPIGYSTGER